MVLFSFLSFSVHIVRESLSSLSSKPCCYIAMITKSQGKTLQDPFYVITLFPGLLNIWLMNGGGDKG